MDQDFPSWYPVQIRFRDLDPLAHVNNTVYFIYYEEARSYYFEKLKPWLEHWPSQEEHQHKDEETQGSVSRNPRIQTGSRGPYGMLVKEITCTYVLPLVHNDQAE